MPETVRTYTTEHRTVYTQKIITDEAGKITSEVWTKGSKALKDGVYLSPAHADKAKSYFDKHLEKKKTREEAETFALKIIKDLRTLSYSQANGIIVFFDDRFYRTSVVKKVSPGFEGGLSDEDIEKALSVPGDKKSGSELEDSLSGVDLGPSSGQNSPQPQKDYNQPLPSQIKPDLEGNLKSQTKPAEKSRILSKLSPFSVFKKQTPKKKNK